MQTTRVRGLPRVVDDIQISPGLRDAPKNGVPPLTVLRAPRGYGKTSLLSTWLTRGIPLDQSHYIALTPASRSPEAFWEEISTGLGGEAEGPGGLLQNGDDHTRLLVIDNYHLAGADGDPTEVDEQLIDLLRRSENLFVILAGRSPRPIETLGAMALPVNVIGPKELRLDTDRLHLLATSLGVNLSRSQAVHLTDGVGGWPALLRTSLGHAALTGEEPELKLPALMSYLDVVIDDAGSPDLRRFVFSACSVDELTPEIARALTDTGSGAQLLRHTHSLGLLRRIPDTTAFEFPRAIKRALFEMMRAEEPDLAQHTYHILAKIQGGTADPFQLLRQAIDAGDWDGAIEVLQEDFVDLVTQRPGEAHELVSQLPVELQRDSSHAKVVLREALSVAPAPDVVLPWSAPVSTGGTTEILGEIGAGEPASWCEISALLTWGLAAAASGQMDMAVYILNRCWERAGQAEGFEPHAHVAASIISAVHAYQGEIHQARSWIAEGRELNGADSAAPPPSAQRGYAFAAAMTSTDAGEEDAGPLLAEITEPKHREIMWALIMFARARHTALHPQTYDVVSQANELRSAMRYMTKGSVSEAVLINALVELLFTLDMLPVVRELLNRLAPTDTATILHARLALAENDFPEAARYASQVPDSLSQFPRTVVERDIILASAAHGLGDFAGASEYFQRAIATIRGNGQVRPLALLPYYLFVALADGDEAVLTLWPGPEAPPGAPGALEQLTPREVQILRSLAHLSGPSAVAEAVGLSLNTVKTHVQSIYRKLGVKSRAEAVAHLK